MFSTNATISIAFNRYFQRQRLHAAVQGLQQKRGKTYIGVALEKSVELFTKAYGSRENAAKVLVLLTDGKNKGPEIGPAAKKLREKNVRVIAVGVGPKINAEQLKEAAGTDGNVFEVTTFKALGPVIAKLIPASCPRPDR